MPLKCLSLNIKGLNHPAKRFPLWKEASTAKADILSAQEIHFHKDVTPKCLHKEYPHIFLASTSEKKQGVLLALSKSLYFQLKTSLLDKGRLLLLGTLTHNHIPLLLWLPPTPINWGSCARSSSSSPLSGMASYWSVGTLIRPWIPT